MGGIGKDRTVTPMAFVFRTPTCLAREDGNTTIEFAIIAPVLFFFMFGIIEFSLLMYAGTLLEGATTISSRLGKTGFEDEATTGISRQQMIEDMVKEKSSALLNPNYITISTLVYGSFDDIGVPEPFTDENSNSVYDAGEPYTDINGNAQWDPDMGAAGLGGGGGDGFAGQGKGGESGESVK